MKTITSHYPSNIALVKYWGKKENQIPCNASVSMTLSEAFTEIKLQYSEKKNRDILFKYYFDGSPKEDFRKRILDYILRQKVFSDFLKKYAVRVDAFNSFPHSAGIASSASAFAAIAAALLKAVNYGEESDFKKEASRLARLGSGSACRSFYGPFACWGKNEKQSNSSDEYAIPVENIHNNFRSLKDAILIVEDRPKKVSSSIGHALMKDHPFAEARFKQADCHCLDMLSVLKNGDWEAFISITEQEALSLHAMMMTSRDYYLLMKPDTVHILEQILQFRKDTGLPLCFTLDAGPNVHLLYPESVQDKVHVFLANHLQDRLKSVIYDRAGEGGRVF